MGSKAHHALGPVRGTGSKLFALQEMRRGVAGICFLEQEHKGSPLGAMLTRRPFDPVSHLPLKFLQGFGCHLPTTYASKHGTVPSAHRKQIVQISEIQDLQNSQLVLTPKDFPKLSDHSHDRI